VEGEEEGEEGEEEEGKEAVPVYGTRVEE